MDIHVACCLTSRSWCCSSTLPIAAHMRLPYGNTRHVSQLKKLGFPRSRQLPVAEACPQVSLQGCRMSLLRHAEATRLPSIERAATFDDESQVGLAVRKAKKKADLRTHRDLSLYRFRRTLRHATCPSAQDLRKAVLARYDSSSGSPAMRVFLGIHAIAKCPVSGDTWGYKFQGPLPRGLLYRRLACNILQSTCRTASLGLM